MSQNTKLDDNFKKNIVTIYDTIYKSSDNQYIDIFLCGGVSTKEKRSVRDSLRVRMEKNKKLRILYPEDLFNELMNIDRNYDLLSLEYFLAQNCDFIGIVCESPGSLVELGAFANHSEIKARVIAMIEKKRKRDKSFIMLGPIKTIKKTNKDNVLYYSPQGVNELSKELISQINRLYNKGDYKKSKSINNIIGIHYFIPMVLYFHHSVEVDTMLDGLRYLLKEHCKVEVSDDNMLFRPALKLLYKEKRIIRDGKVYRLTDMGYKYMRKVLSNTNLENRTRLQDEIAFDILRGKYYS